MPVSLKITAPLGAAVLLTFSAGLACAAPAYETAELQTVKTPAEVRSCLAGTLASRGRPVETPNAAGREATAWDIAFTHQREAKVVRVEKAGVGGARILYPRRLGVDPAPVYDLVRACI